MEIHKAPCSVCGDTDWRVGWRSSVDERLYYLCPKHRHLRDPPEGIRVDEISEPRECGLYDALTTARIRSARLAEVERERDAERMRPGDLASWQCTSEQAQLAMSHYDGVGWADQCANPDEQREILRAAITTACGPEVDALRSDAEAAWQAHAAAGTRADERSSERDHALAQSIRAQDAAGLARKQRDHWRRRAEKAEAHLARILAKEGGNTL